jgi:IS5 family transposase
MHQTKKGNQWYFDMKTHIGVDVHSRKVPVYVVTPNKQEEAP